MYKTLSIVALAAAATAPAFAQSSVTMYGRLNVTMERQKFGDGDAQWAEQNNASRLGMKGTEDLGGGLKAGFQIEHGFNIDTGSQSQSNFWARQSEVNLSGGFGMVRLGNFTSEAYYATADYISMHNHDTGTSSDALWAYVGRNTNKVAYRTPDISGFTAEVSVSAADAGEPDRTIDVAANYNLGKLALGAGYAKDGDTKAASIRGLYEFGPVVVGAYYQRDVDGYGVGLGSRNTFRLSGMYGMGASEFHVNVGRAASYSNVASSAATQWTLGYNYNLSKRTKVYGFYTKLSDSVASVYGGDFSSFAVGVRHNF